MMEKELRIKRRGLSFIFCLLLAIYYLLLTSFIVLAQEEEHFVYESSGRRDPMIPLVTSKGLIRDIKSLGARTDLYLEGIIYDEDGKSFAIIDGQIVKAGDTIGEAEILDIQKDKVIILKDNQSQEIKLAEEEE